VRAAGPPPLRGPGKAAPLAERAVRLAPGQADYHATLALAHYRLDRLDAARLQAETSATQRGEASAFDLCLLALVYGR
jgi:hypothetical protein